MRKNGKIQHRFLSETAEKTFRNGPAMAGSLFFFFFLEKIQINNVMFNEPVSHA